MLPYLLAPGLAMGLAGSWRHVALVSGAAAAGLTGGRAAYEVGARPVIDSALPEYAVTTGQWVLLSLAFGLIAGQAQRLVIPVTASRRSATSRRASSWSSCARSPAGCPAGST